jgi:ribosomal-protein-alanine N-acetyltransferase
MGDLTILPMRKTHITRVLEIEREAFATPWTREMFRQEVEDDHVSRSYVALEDRQLLGYLVAWFFRQEVHLLNIAVTASYQRRGIGGRMLRFLLDLAARENKEVVTLEVRESNWPAIGLYQAFGFVRIGVQQQYYQSDKEDALLMMRPITAADKISGT